MNRNAEAWARFGRALREARLREGLTQEQLAGEAGVSTKSVQDAEGGKVPKARMPYTLTAIAKTLGWPVGSVDAVLGGAPPPGGWQDVSVPVDEETVVGILTSAIVRATDNVTAAEIRNATQLAIDELRRRGIIRDGKHGGQEAFIQPAATGQ